MMWRSISRAHEVLARHHSQFATTPTDTRLAEQLSIVSMLHEWRPTTATEARELAYLLDLYAEPAGDATSDEAANAANAAIRRMAVRRVKAGPPESWETAS